MPSLVPAIDTELASKAPATDAALELEVSMNAPFG